jgi:hypothetical protein
MERDTQSGDGEVAVCHVCKKEFPTQQELFAHLENDHDGELLAEDGESGGAEVNHQPASPALDAPGA